MKSKNTNLRRLKRNVKELGLDVEAILEEHDKNILIGSTKEAEEWFFSLPIETLSESMNLDRNIPNEKYSLHKMKQKFHLKKLYEEKKDELESKQRELKVARIDYVISNIDSVLER